MAWDDVWEQIFKERASWGRYPNEELVRFFARNYFSSNDRSSIRVLEIGCGPGAGSSWFVAREGFSLYGVDGSPTAIERSKQRFEAEGLKGDFRQGFFDRLPYESKFFDVVIDIASLQHNDEKETSTIASEVLRVLKPGGRFFSFTAHAGSLGDGTGEFVDETTRRGVTIGPCRGTGKIRFASSESLKRIYSGFENLRLDSVHYRINSNEGELSHWIVHAEAPQ